jgi:hypothetical protein
MDNPSICQVRACLTAGDPWGLTSVTNGGTLYIEPIFGRRIGLWNGTATVLAKVAALSLSLSGKTAQNYRLYVWDSNSDGTIDSSELVAWTNSTTAPSDTLVADGYLVKTGATNRRAVADVMLHGTAQCDWREARRGICHIDERSRRLATLNGLPTNDSWAIPGGTNWRRVAAGSTIGEHFVEFILSSTTLVSAEALMVVERSNGSGLLKYELGFGLDVTNASAATQPYGYDANILGGTAFTAQAKYRANVAAGKRTLNLLEQNTTNRNANGFGDNADTVFKSGMLVQIML